MAWFYEKKSSGCLIWPVCMRSEVSRAFPITFDSETCDQLQRVHTKTAFLELYFSRALFLNGQLNKSLGTYVFWEAASLLVVLPG